MKNFDNGSKFKVTHRGYTLDFSIAICKHTGEVYGIQRQSVLKAQYSQKDIEENNAYSSAPHIQDGEVVNINGSEYTTKVYGDYLDGVHFIEVVA